METDGRAQPANLKILVSVVPHIYKADAANVEKSISDISRNYDRSIRLISK